METITKNLNNKQLEAVTETEGYVRVIAGAGSGKTKALTSRYAYIVNALGIDSSNILCVTFTNKASQEMRKRVKNLIGKDSDVSLITTYHGFCVKVLREDINKIQYPRNFIIMDVEDQKIVLREVFNELGITSRLMTFKQCLQYISIQKDSFEYLTYVLNHNELNSESMMDKVFYKYLEKQHRNFALDFDDLINFAIHIFLKYPEILEKWQHRIHYIQVDETQDSSKKQFSIIEMLSRVHENLFVVGDPDQTIYEWRGAKPEILVDFDKEFDDVKTIIMNQNYRSTPNILTIGNHIIKNNKIRVAKDMFTENSKGVDVVHFHARNDIEEGKWVANEILGLIKKKKAILSEIAVLYRANFVSRAIEQSLIRENIPYSVFGGIRFFERKEIKDVLAWLRLIEMGDDFSFLRVINNPSRGLGKKFIASLKLFANKDNCTLIKALENNFATPELARKGAQDFLELVTKFRAFRETMKVSDLAKKILDESGLTEFYRRDGDTDRLDNLKELLNSIILIERDTEEDVSLAEYLQEIALYTDMDMDSEKNEKVKLMTIHTSKGLEFPYVFLCGFTEGILPSALSIKERKERALEEERRLAYVAITRAEKGFYMTESEGHNFSTGLSKYPSRFLFEISQDFYVRKGKLPEEITNISYQIEKPKQKNAFLDSVLGINDLVKHPVWKEGKIIKVDIDKGVYEIEFPGIKKVKPIKFGFEGIEKI